MGAAAGGVWKTTDGGNYWEPIFDGQSAASIGAIAVAPSNPNIIYVGTGEACIRGDFSYGDGVYKSLDDGRTWKNMGLRDTRHIGAVIVDPGNPDVVFVAALGHAYGPNPERGIFRSTDGGITWIKALSKDEKTGGIDIVFDPKNSSILYASLWEAYRTPYSLCSGGPGSGLYKSIDGGTTWKRLEGHGLPGGILGRIGVSVSGADSERVYAMIEAKDSGLYRSDDGGKTWTTLENQPTAQFYHVTTDNRFPYYIYGAQQDNTSLAIASRDDEGAIGRQNWYAVGGGECGYIAPDPRDADIVYAGNEGLLTRFDTHTGQARDVSVWPLDVSGHGAEDLEYRFQWTSPMFLSPHDPDVIYTTMQKVFKSTDHGASWRPSAAT
jgi:photosystem II stability/assembly factor-like uncharacterized protein